MANTFSSKVKNYFKGKSVVITGAGSGIGQATAKTFADFGCHVILTDINDIGLAETKAMCEEGSVASVETHNVNVADFDAMQAMANDVMTRFNPVDVIVNNAGFALGGSLLQATCDDWESIIDVNVMGVVNGCKLFIPAMQAVQDSAKRHVVNIASVAGLISPPNMAVYATTKFAVVGFSEGLRAEVAADNITVTAICPGLIKTNILENAPYFGTQTQQARLKRNLGSRQGTTDQVTRAIVKSIMKNRAVTPVKGSAWMAYYIKRFFPSLSERMMLKVASKLKLNRPDDV